MKQGDTGVTFTDTLTAGGSPVDLTGATVKFLLKNRHTGTLQIDGAATIVSAINGQVSYQPTADDVAIAGVFLREWEITLPSGKILTVPNSTRPTLEILPDLNS